MNKKRFYISIPFSICVASIGWKLKKHVSNHISHNIYHILLFLSLFHGDAHQSLEPPYLHFGHFGNRGVGRKRLAVVLLHQKML